MKRLPGAMSGRSMKAHENTKHPARGKQAWVCDAKTGLDYELRAAIRPADAASPSPRLYALVPCAGTGSRAGTRRSQAVRARSPASRWSGTRWRPSPASRASSRTWSCVAPDDGYFERHADCHRSAPGGRALRRRDARARRVRNGLRELRRARRRRDNDWVLVHDAARCLVTPELIDALIDACAQRRGRRPARACRSPTR